MLINVQNLNDSIEKYYSIFLLDNILFFIDKINIFFHKQHPLYHWKKLMIMIIGVTSLFSARGLKNISKKCQLVEYSNLKML